jgi:hypothetical protein
MMRSSETSVHIRIIRRFIQKDGIGNLLLLFNFSFGGLISEAESLPALNFRHNLKVDESCHIYKERSLLGF